MPRKKSAAKKAKEAKQNLKEQVVAPVKDVVKETPVSESDESSSSENEDEYGELITEEVEDGINNVISAIRNNDMDQLLNGEVRFFEDPENAVKALGTVEKQKPIYLKDYHRMNLLNGETFKDDESDHDMGEVEQPYAEQQITEKKKLLDEIKNAFDGEDEENSSNSDDDEGFLKKKVSPEATKSERVHLPDPSKNEEAFLDEFINQQAWIPKKGDKVMTGDGEMKIEEDDEEFEDAVEQFEHAYNFRYEDPNAAEIVSYARNQATLRRSNNSSRRKKRNEEKDIKQTEIKKKDEAIQKKKTEKVHKLTDVLNMIKKEYGADIDENMVKKITNTLLNSDYKDNEWDQVVAELFNDEFYNQKSKPTWDDDDDLLKGIDMSEDGSEDEDEGKNDEDTPVATKSRKERKGEKKSKKLEKKNLTKLVENAVEQNKLSLVEEFEQEQEERKSRSRSKDDDKPSFRYREVSPESFGLTTREIFNADDTQLNQFIGLKKFAPYRPKELRMKDKRKVTKSKRIREWRKEVFKNEKGLGETDEIEIPVEKSKASHHHHKSHKKRKHNNH
ncbi:hypothetical protein TPHA_0A00430 [Tetrapisispora phaffii CBS 4417]|uniref:Kri1-like C-terminal domain-containing protein n=1 Tax=Tetrapisispora phaffii (strain ATCC 24235 / CBS 4417 / NBRC 1672 / NRRL Y-8282 / UCD 70-5) TaxID=1071381 RepID=G8BMK0_TETPH|nr:hypothetical protein TPHA_0A00430 [Tetrapisispora phaffii CBS 4417]CCE61128.1 hypothetical protein TPHA_0A00430 [Tetrapisispora phaffii CBS 4417]